MKITLISLFPSIESFGIATLSACLKKEGHEVKLVFLLNDFWNRYEDKTLNELVKISSGADLIGISLMTNFFDNAVQITQKLKNEINRPIIWGGIHPTIRPFECLKYADMVCVGEGEKSLLELLYKMEKGKDYYDVEGIYFKKNGKIIKNKLRTLIRSLDSIPFPDYNYGDDYYILDEGRIKGLSKELHKKYFSIYRTIATRGCPYTCTYCVNNTLSNIFHENRMVRKRRPENLTKELIEVKERLPFIKQIEFNDDAFLTYSLEEIKEFCRNYKKNIRMPFTVFAGNPSAVTREKISLLVDAGMVKIRIGIQSSCERIRRMYKRNHSLAEIERAVKIINEFRDKIEPLRIDVILDNPWETEDETTETLKFLAKIPRPYYLYLYSLTFYPETELYSLAKKEGLISNDINDVYRKYYHDIKNCYINSLFILLNRLCPYGGGG